MENISAAWLYPIIIIAGVLQAWGPPMTPDGRGHCVDLLLLTMTSMAAVRNCAVP